MLAVLAPGQGSQRPGFLEPWLELPSIARRIGWFSSVVGTDLARAGTMFDAAQIRATDVAQPLLVASALAAAHEILPKGMTGTQFVTAGHSVGEFAATTLAGVLSDEQALVAVRVRGEAMAEAGAATATGMAVVLGGKEDDVLATITQHGLTAANFNGPGQVVAAGTVPELNALLDDPPARTRVVRLAVAGAFHTAHMAPAVSRLAEVFAGVDPRDPTALLLSNRDGGIVRHGDDALARLAAQVARPVRWDLCMDKLAELGVTGVLELPPAGTLVGLVRRRLDNVQVFALEEPAGIDDAKVFCARHLPV